MDEPIQIYLTCYHVLQSYGDSRSDDMLQQAHDRLMANADKIIDPATRARFLERVPAHHELMQLWGEREG